MSQFMQGDFVEIIEAGHPMWDKGGVMVDLRSDLVGKKAMIVALSSDKNMYGLIAEDGVERYWFFEWQLRNSNDTRWRDELGESIRRKNIKA